MDQQDLTLKEMGSSVFICYASEDSSFVLKLVASSKDLGVPIWLGQWDTPAGDD